MLNIAVCVSGSGTNLQAIIDAVKSKRINDVRIALVIASNTEAFALERARKENIRAVAIAKTDYPSAKEMDEVFLDELERADTDLIVLAGYLREISKKCVEKYRGRIINIHPSLIPSFCGRGYYGLKVHEKALERGVKISGATVHFVDEDMDTGPIILQKSVEVKNTDTPETLQRRVMEEAEWLILPKAIDLIAHEKVRLKGNCAVVIE